MPRPIQPDHERRGRLAALRAYQYGAGDPTTQIGSDGFWRATWTPDGIGTVHIDVSGDEVAARGWGPGGDWLVAQATAMCGANDDFTTLICPDAVVEAARRKHAYVRIGASRTLYHELLPNILGQRITGGEAITQWHRLVRRLGDPAPGPRNDLLAPPPAARLASTPTWWFHPLGIEAKRATPLIEVARHATKLWAWADLGPVAGARQLALLRGVGPWTIASAIGPALGDPDAVAVGDFHLKNLVSFALAGEPRGTDERMLELLEPYAGQRGRVIRWLQLDGHAPPKFGPRQRILPMARW